MFSSGINRQNMPTTYAATMLFILSALFIIAIGRFTNLDLLIEDYYYSPALKTFLWKNSWFAKQLMHVYVKDIIMMIALGCIGFVIIDALRAFKFVDRWLRIRLRFVAVAAMIVPAFISGLKQMSTLHCPWDVQRYGGSTPYFRLFDVIPPNMEAGQCFPAGHASTGLWLAAFCVFWLPHRPRMALFIFLAGLGVGFVLGWVQQMRGAHFLTHTLWSMWIASVMIFIMLCLSKSLLQKS
jgi:membrane-associated PAP2 superfamily phosphatase